MNHYHIDIDELRRLWEAGWLVEDLAAKFRCTPTYVYWLRKKYGIQDRCRSQSTEPPPPSPEDAAASQGSLALSPWVAQRAEMFRREKERRGEAARLEIGVTTLVTAGPRRRRMTADA
jgi:hypothetical protein